MLSAGRVALFVAPFLFASLSAETFEDVSARATAARESNNLPEAVKLYREALQLNPQWQAGWWFLGTILYDTNEYTGCRDALTHVVQLKDSVAPAWGILGLCEFQTRDYSQALTHIQRSFSLGAMDQPELEKVLRYHEAILLTHAGEFDRALQKFVWFLRGSMPTPILLTALGLAALRAPLLPGDVPEEQRDLYVMAGTAAFYQMSGDIAHAQQAMQTLLQRYPSAHHVHYLYACSLLAADPERAIDEFERELRNTPDSEGTLTMLSWALLNRADAASAKPYAQRAITRDRPSTLAQYVYGRSLVETGDVEAGIKYLEKAEHSDPDNLEYHLALASAYPKARRYEDARRERRRSLELARNTGASAQR